MKRLFSFGLASVAMLGVIAVTLAPQTGADLVSGDLPGVGRRLSPTSQAGTQASASAPADTAPFLTATIQRGPLEQVVTVTGSLRPVETVEVGSQLSGQIDKLLVDFNDRVRQGDPLAIIDQRSYITKVAGARSSLDMAKAEVRIVQAKLDKARIDLENAKASRAVLVARLDSAKAQKTAAERNLERKLALKSHNVASVTTVEEAQTNLAAAAALAREQNTVIDLNAYTVEAAEAEVRRLDAELSQVRAAVPLRESELRIAEIDLDRTTIRSPMDGVVVGRFVNQGQTLAAGLEARTAFTVARNLEEMEVHALVDETDIGRIKAGQHASFTVDAFPNRRFDAVVRQVRKAAQMSQNVVTYTVVLSTDNRDGLLLPGMTALVKLIVHRDEDVLKVPLAALRFTPSDPAARETAANLPKGQAVWVRGPDGRIAPVNVTTGASSADQVALKSGSLAEGDVVVVGQASDPVSRRLFGIRIGL
jgi:HlyD family secretion protein